METGTAYAGAPPPTVDERYENQAAFAEEVILQQQVDRDIAHWPFVVAAWGWCVYGISWIAQNDVNRAQIQCAGHAVNTSVDIECMN